MYWTKNERKDLKKNVAGFHEGIITSSKLRNMYRGRTVNDIVSKAIEIGYPKSVMEDMSIPNYLKAPFNRMIRAGYSRETARDLLLGKKREIVFDTEKLSRFLKTELKDNDTTVVVFTVSQTGKVNWLRTQAVVENQPVEA